ncbi:hypothetical protein KEM54_004889 [Ascosphaera aggregata]|nr:hypothetical protein KEM54_004889 [Ascosphaera aggregata]
MTAASIAIWHTRPTAVVAAVTRSERSLMSYGPNVAIQLSPDSTIIVVQTSRGYLITYSIAMDSVSRTYQQRIQRNVNRRNHLGQQIGVGEANGFPDVSIRFRVVIKIDSGINKSLALEQEIILSTVEPSAVQLIRWTPDKSGNQSQAVLLRAFPWMIEGECLVDMVYDRAMNIFLWLTDFGNVYAVQRARPEDMEKNPHALFTGHRFHTASEEHEKAVKAAVNAKFSLFAVSCVGGSVHVYTARDYTGNIPLTHSLQMPASPHATGRSTVLSYSPDGYCLFAGFEHGWTTWSVFGKPGGGSFQINRPQAEANSEAWLTGLSLGCWAAGGSSMILIAPDDTRVFVLDFARSALTGYFSANLARALLHTGTEIMLYRGHNLSDLTTISGKDSLWHHAQFPSTYLNSQWPIRACVASQDGRYVAIAGRRGLAHYSVNSGRWKTFSDREAENSFAVHGGMCWYGHILVAAVTCEESCELRLYSRELSLTKSSMLHTEILGAPAVFIGPSGEDSLLVYTHDDVLYHYVFNTFQKKVGLIQVGQIAFNGIVRAPTRVRSISQVLPDSQLISETGDLKYDMRIIANDVEYYILMRDQLAFNFAPPTDDSPPPTPSSASPHSDISLRDSLWVFCGTDLLVWADVQDVLRPARTMSEDIPKPVPIPLDFYPLSVLLNKGIVLGAESELSQRRDLTFSLCRYAIRTQLFLPYILQYDLAHLDTPAALSICHHFSNLSYFPHALEVLLHHVLDDEVDSHDVRHGGHNASTCGGLLPSVLSFLQAATSTQQYLDIIVQCTRKTELRSWETLFAHLPPPSELFELALKLGSLKTAGGYLLVLQALEINEEGSDAKVEDSVFRLLRRAVDKMDWELCAELARFLIALDHSGNILRRAIAEIKAGHPGTFMSQGLGGSISSADRGLSLPIENGNSNGHMDKMSNGLGPNANSSPPAE